MPVRVRHDRYFLEHLGRRPQLDGLRAVAVASVVAFHSLQVFAWSWSQSFLTGGFAGVDLFFVLSGFLITSLLLEEWAETGQISVPRFYGRRALRLLPALVVVVAAQACYSVATGTSGLVEWRSVGLIAAYLSNFGNAFSTIAPGLAHTWSLGVEEQFYLVWPLLLLSALRRRWSNKALLLAIVAGMAASTIDSMVSWSIDPTWHHLYTRTDINAVSLLAGAGLAVIMRIGIPNPGIVRPLSWIGWIGFVVSLFVFNLTTGPTYMGGLLFIALVSAAMVVGAVMETGPFGRFLTAHAIAWTGRRSYGIYLWHIPIIIAVEEQMRFLPQLMRAVIALLLTLIVSALSYRWVERPFLRRKTRMASVGH